MSGLKKIFFYYELKKKIQMIYELFLNEVSLLCFEIRFYCVVDRNKIENYCIGEIWKI